MMRDFASILQDLQQRFGETAGLEASSDFDDEHVRWWLYKAALNHEESRPVVLEALRFEQDVASPTVIEAVELVAADERMVWVEQLPQGRDRDFAERRVRELEILERLVSDPDATCSVEELQSWTPWLQRRLAAGARSPSLLTILESSATTRRVRGLARNRLQGKRL